MGTKTMHFKVLFITAFGLFACGTETDRQNATTTGPTSNAGQTPTTAEIESPNDDELNTSPTMTDGANNETQIQEADNDMNGSNTGELPEQNENESEMPSETDMNDTNGLPEEADSANCTEFGAEHFYRQTAERFGDYELRSMCDFKGSPILVVNTAARCGFTPQYTGLVELDESYREQGLIILGFLSNDFGNQGGSDEEVERCNRDFRITFEQFSTVGVTPNSQDGQHPVFEWLTSQPGLEGPIQWNFNKFLIDRSGALINRWASTTQPNGGEIRAAIETALSESGEGN